MGFVNLHITSILGDLCLNKMDQTKPHQNCSLDIYGDNCNFQEISVLNPRRAFELTAGLVLQLFIC